MRRKVIIHFIVSLVLSICVCSVAFAAEQPLLTFRHSAEDESYRVIVDLRMNSGIEMLQFCLRYDAEKLEIVSIEQGEIFDNNTGSPTYSNPQEGFIYLAWDALEPLRGGELLVIQFKAKTNASGTAIICIDPDSEAIAADGEYNEIEIEYSRLEIVIGESYQMDTPLPTNQATPTPSTNTQASPRPSSTQQAARTPDVTETDTILSPTDEATSAPMSISTPSIELSTASPGSSVQGLLPTERASQASGEEKGQSSISAFSVETSKVESKNTGNEQTANQDRESQQWMIILVVGLGITLVVLAIGAIIVWHVMKRKTK